MHFQADQSNYELKSSNLIYASKLYNLFKSFKTVITQKFMADAQNVYFFNAEVVRNKINARVEQETNSKIKDLIPQGSYFLSLFIFIKK